MYFPKSYSSRKENLLLIASIFAVQNCRKFQKMTGLRITGKLDQATKKKMVSPRCGVADVAQEGDHAERKINGSLAPERFRLIGTSFN